LATKGKKSPAKKPTETKVTRITAKDTAPAKKPSKKAVEVPTVVNEPIEKKRRKNPFVAIGNYFKGAWYELRQVRWPTRRATWGMTAAMLVYTTFFVVLILLLDALFKYLFEMMLG
jgi:preprotein translocase subunit SecE